MSILSVALRLFIPLTFAQAKVNPCPLKTDLPCIGGGISGLSQLINAQVPLAEDIFYGLLFLMVMIYAISLIVGSTEESAITETRKAFTYALIASFIVFFRKDIQGAFQTGDNNLLNGDHLKTLFDSVLTTLQIIAAGAAIAFVTVRAIRLITSNEEGSISSQRKLFLNAVFGVGVLVLAGTLVSAAGGNTGILNQQAAGIILYILYILGALLVLGIVIGGAMLVVSYDEAIQERAKKSIFASIIVLIVLICFAALVSLITFS